MIVTSHAELQVFSRLVYKSLCKSMSFIFLTCVNTVKQIVKQKYDYHEQKTS